MMRAVTSTTAVMVSVLLVGCPSDTATSTDTAGSSSTGTGDTTDVTPTGGGSGEPTEPGGATEPATSAGTGMDTEVSSTGETTGLAACGNGAVEPGEGCDLGADNGSGGMCGVDCQPASCGDGVVNGGEQCDDGPDNGDGNSCTADCTDIVCGDGKIGPGEGCDDGNQVDDDECTNACALASCGDGEVAPAEACDDGNQDNTDACTTACTVATCSDGFVQPGAGEACDDGAGNADDAACTTACQGAFCGDGFVWTDGGTEACDLGAGNGPGKACNATCGLNVCGDGDNGPDEACDDGDLEAGDGCSAACVLEGCGNGVLDPNEECDDGMNGDDDDGCTDACGLPACGDGIVQASLAETCDLGGANSNGGGCTLGCALAACGDGLVYTQVEQCDDGTDNGPGKACNAMCALNVCGDGDQGPGEACDDGNQVNADGCTAVCKLASCGDGFVQPGEQCDLGGGNVNTGTCTLACLLPVCGDGYVQAGEACDDGNQVDDATCSATCQEPVGSLECATLEASEPIIVDNLELGGGMDHAAPVAMAWHDDLVLARAYWAIDGTNDCDIKWERRDATGQLLAPPKLIKIPNINNNSLTCEQIGDIAYDAAHDQYIFIHPQGSGKLRNMPVALSPAGELKWIGSGAMRMGNTYTGVVSQIRVVGSKVFVLGLHDNVTVRAAAVYEYDALTGVYLGQTLHAENDMYHSGVSCDAECKKGVAVYEKGNGLYMQALDLVTRMAVGAPIVLGGHQYDGYSPSAVMWRTGTTYFATSVPYTANGSYVLTNTISVGVGWSGMPHQSGLTLQEYYEPSIIETDDGYVIAASGANPGSSKIPVDFTKVGTRVWNIAYDGTVRGTFSPNPGGGHTPRIAYKAGKVALTFVNLNSQVDDPDTRRLLFLKCPN